MPSRQLRRASISKKQTSSKLEAPNRQGLSSLWLTVATEARLIAGHLQAPRSANAVCRKWVR